MNDAFYFIFYFFIIHQQGLVVRQVLTEPKLQPLQNEVFELELW